jgi:hypothetical protein
MSPRQYRQSERRRASGFQPRNACQVGQPMAVVGNFDVGNPDGGFMDHILD